MEFEENQPLAPFTTLGIGGPARWFAEVASEEEIAEAADWARRRGLPLFVLGGGSNLVVSDAGFDGLVLHVALRGVEVEVRAGELSEQAQQPARIYRVAAGEDWDGFVDRALKDNCAGIECLAGIPGTVGGTPVQNVGAYGQEVASVVERVRAYDLEANAFVELTAGECGFSYRRSRFNSTDRGRFVVTRVDYRLVPGGAPVLTYPDVQRAMERLRAAGIDATLAKVAAVVRAIRHAKGMLLVDGDPDCRSAGSFFKNPVISTELCQKIAARSAFPAGPGMVKVPAAWLIEQTGFRKGYGRGGAAISSKHMLALVNRDGATAAEILALAGEIAAAVETRFGIRLEVEPVMVGC
ncbi:MAG: UDP-N-acetylmuramate dehydrogenase [Terracidiphilus sp.]